MSRQERRYQPNVTEFLALCGRNYHKVLPWLAEPSEIGSHWLIRGQIGELTIRLLEKTKYTQLIEVSRPCQLHDKLSQPKMLVRVYHDAQLAEVLTSQQIYRLLPVYHYPNKEMHQPNEKYQINAFLEEILNIGCHDTVTHPTHNDTGK